MWGAWAWSEPKSVGARFTAIYAALGLGAYLLQKTADLIDVNAQFELTAALAVGLGLAIDRLPRTAVAARFGAGRVRLAGIFLLALWLVRLSRPEPLLLLTSDAFRATVRGNAAVVASEVARVAAIEGNVACVYQTICYRAGKPFVFDVTYAVAGGRITQQQADQGIAVPGVVMIDIDRRVSARALACRNCR